MLNVLTFSSLYPNAVQPNFGGFVERQTTRLAARSDVDLKVLAPIGTFLPIGPYAALTRVPKRGEHNGIPVFWPRFPLLPAVGWRFNPAFAYHAGRRVLLDLIADGFCPDVIDCEFFWPDGPAAVRLGRSFGIPVSIKARGSDIRLWGAKPAARRLMVDAANAADGLLAVSESLKADMVAIGMPEEKIRVHRTGIELDRFHPVERSAAKASLGVSGPLLLAVGNLVALKRFELVIGAAELLPDATLFIAGEGRERRKLEALIAERGLSARVRLLGSVHHAEMPALMAAADVFVHASSSEGLANVWVEALASGTPVVTANVGAAAEVVDSAEAGTLIDDARPEVFADAIRAVLEAPPLPEAVRTSSLRFDWKNNTNALHAHLLALVSGPEAQQ
ncbi:glycosyltransferase [Sphingosinicella microcystinivorans]|uniref:Glycosyl transferase family 1 n=1 Tax=Sphingosinicella microcystinivorans TaxID=335406 RepID=A0AAD1D7I0_SPHMI|nr:glycosyltransferase [Sphingosinicella microcystinivorans]RKS86574.1 glycosyltransferase involved in cell wall biosynthesis [Sphingosinicella microcystinivorans]BBE35318.1 glycosyl transferase family 1 [Sphingosinicella microcystinivorans]